VVQVLLIALSHPVVVAVVVEVQAVVELLPRKHFFLAWERIPQLSEVVVQVEPLALMVILLILTE
jgi:hypothetical protein